MTLRRTIKIKRRGDQGQMTKSLWRIAQLLTTSGNLLGKHGQMVSETHHVLENVDRTHEVFLLVDASARQGFHEPECTHAESTFFTSHSYRLG